PAVIRVCRKKDLFVGGNRDAVPALRTESRAFQYLARFSQIAIRRNADLRIGPVLHGGKFDIRCYAQTGEVVIQTVIGNLPDVAARVGNEPDLSVSGVVRAVSIYKKTGSVRLPRDIYYPISKCVANFLNDSVCHIH